MKELRVVFMGTPQFSVPSLESLIDNTNVVLVVCQPDKERDKKGNIIFPPTKKLALEHGIPVYQPVKIRRDYEEILSYNPDIIITCAYGQIIPDEILEFPKYGCINIHGSLLPKFRGGAPIHWAIISGEEETGITIMDMVSAMDAGDIISSRSIKISEDDYLDKVYEKLSLVGRDLLMETLPSIIDGTCKRVKQDLDKVTFGMNIKKEEEKIDFSRTAKEIRNLVRGLNSVPGAYAIFGDKRMKIYDVSIIDKDSNDIPGKIVDVTKNSIIVSTGDKLLSINDIKLEGKKRCKVRDYLNGINDKNSIVGKVLK